MRARWGIVTIRLKEVYAYRMEILIWLINPTLQLILLAAVWRAVYAGRDSVDGVSLTAMTTYVSVAAMHTLVIRDDTVQYVEKRIRTGVVAMDLLRPVGLLEQTMWSQLSQLLVKFPMVALVAPVAALFSGLSLPTDVGPYALAALLGWLVNCCLMLLLASIAFWTMEMGGTGFLYFVISGFLSGALVPLWFMPTWLADIIGWLPQQATLFTPVAIYVGQLAGADAWRAIGVQLLWLALLSGVVVLVWRRGVRRVVVQGG